MLVLRKKINKNNIKFLCVSGDTSSGFYHKVKLYINDSLISDSKINYYNRTWETFTYQTACNSALNVAYNTLFDTFIYNYKMDNDITRLPKNKKTELQKEFNKKDIIKTILKAKKIVKNSNNANEFKKEYFNI